MDDVPVPENKQDSSSTQYVNSDLLGAHVVDLLSGQSAEVVAYDSGRNQYRIEFIANESDSGNERIAAAYWSGNHGAAGEDELPYEAGHSAWRSAAELGHVDIGE